MQIEMIEIREHLAQHAPFDTLPEEVLDELATQVEVAYFRKDSTILEAGSELTELHYVRSGAVDLFRRNGELHNRLTEGDIFGQSSLLRGGKVRLAAKAYEDSLIYFIPGELFFRLCEEHESFADFVEAEGQPRLKAVLAHESEANELRRVKLRRLISRRPVWVAPDTTVRDAAQIMTEEEVSGLLVVQPGPVAERESELPATAPERMLGILTDRDLRTRVLAADLPASTTVRDIMTPRPITLAAQDSVFDAMLAMLRHNVHHLPVVHRGHVVGVVQLADIVRFESRSSLVLVRSIFQRGSTNELQDLLPDLRATFVRMVADQATAHMVGQAMSSIGRAFCQRLCELAEQELGPPPVPYCFLVAGSLARDEQLMVTDQDNALVLDDAYNPTEHGEYFEQFAHFVSDGLAACGYQYCKGGIMATNPRWRQPLSEWKRMLTEWIHRPNPETLLHSSVFFDLDGAHGETVMVDELRDLIATRASRDGAFLSAMAGNALNRTPPLGVFRTFVMEKSGEQRNIINLKGRGTAPLVDLIRVHALTLGTTAQSSIDRLRALEEERFLPASTVESLRYAFEYLTLVRIRHQAEDIEAGREPNNYVEPDRFSDTERQHLKDAFQILSNAQNFLRIRYPARPRGWKPQ